MVGLAAHERAPYRGVLTHGWVVDGQGKAMHKSAGNAVAPDEVIKQSGAEILRLWTASTDYMEDVRCSDEILQRVGDAYRKLRNTARFALGNLAGFDPQRDYVSHGELPEIDRWALAELDAVIERALVAYRAYEFHTVYHALYHFSTVTLSARYFDIIKDRLYTSAPRAHARRAAQTVLYEIADALARLLAPILVFTADEIWENLPPVVAGAGDASVGRVPSVHLATFPVRIGERDAELRARWAQLFEVRDEVLRALEEARTAKLIGSGLDARVEIAAREPVHSLLASYGDELRYVFIVSQVGVMKTEDEHAPAVRVTVARAEGQKCERCWNYSTHVGTFNRYPTVCERCVVALAEIEAEGAEA
jgi:isoleucyl-tRNA synthetase